MKTRFITILYVALLAISVSCKKNDENPITPITLSQEMVSVDKAGGEVLINVKYPGPNLEIHPNVEWIMTGNVVASQGSSTITFIVGDNTSGYGRTGVISFSSNTQSQTFKADLTINQEGGKTLPCSIAEFKAAEEGFVTYCINAAVYGINGKEIVLRDFSGDVSILDPDMGGFDKFHIGDILTVVGKRKSYNGNPVMADCHIDEIKSVKEISISNFRKAQNSKDQLYLLSGTVGKPTENGTKYDLSVYGNLSLFDKSGNQIYVYGVSTGVGGTPKNFGSLGVKEGDTLSVIAYKDSYTKNDFTLHQAGGAMYFSHN